MTCSSIRVSLLFSMDLAVTDEHHDVPVTGTVEEIANLTAALNSLPTTGSQDDDVLQWFVLIQNDEVGSKKTNLLLVRKNVQVNHA